MRVKRECVSWSIAAIAILVISGASTAHAAAPDPPVVALGAGTTWVDEIGLYSVSYRGMDGRVGAFPVGWTGMFDDATGVSATEFGVQNGRRAYLLHPMWRGSTGDADQSYRLTLPPGRAAHLKFGVAIGQAAQRKSDGVTFRVFVDGKPAFERNTASEAWMDADIDLSAAAGRTVRLTFETDPGPRHDPSFDYGLWGDRRIVVSGGGAATPPAPATGADYRLDTAVAGWGASSPTYPVGVKTGVTIISHVAEHGTGLFDGLRFTVVCGKSSEEIPFANFARVVLVAPDGTTVASDNPSVTSEMSQSRLANGVVRRVATYTLGGRVVRLTADISPYRGSSARIEIRGDDPDVASVDFGVIGPTAMRRGVQVPYLESNVVQYLPMQRLFSSVFVDFARSGASHIDAANAVYGALTDGTRNTVRETAYFALSPDFASVLPTPPNPASPYRAALGGRIVLDHWRHVDFASNAAWLDLLASYGLTDILTIVHDWQNGGYDNKLPDTLPARAALGGNDGMRVCIAAAKRHGELIALHDNYADLYPNAASFDLADAAQEPSGKTMLAWKNLIQSYAVAPSSIVKLATIHTTQIHETLAPNAGYLDVHSSAPPSFHVDYRAGAPGAGKMQTVIQANTRLWSLTRRLYGGPVLGEGARDWTWAGLLDGVEGQFGVGVPSNGGQSAPLFVDFALLKVHPRMLNHGMGYLERWLATPAPVETLPPSVLDQYRMQEIIYGHTGFVANPLVDSLPFIWREHNLVLPVTRRYAVSPVRAIRYEVAGKMMDTSAAVAARSAFDRARVTYANGLQISANGRAQDWSIATNSGPVTLAPYGWVAEGPDVLAYTARRGGRIVDYARTPATIFADCRAVPLVQPQKTADLTPRVAHFARTAARKFEIAVSWDVREKLPAGEAVFIHVVRPSSPDEIPFQIPSSLPSPDDWPVGELDGRNTAVTLPDDLPDGDYSIRIGLYSPNTGERVALHVKDDGSRRYEIGVLHIGDRGGKIAFQPVSLAALATPGARAARPSRPIDFGPVATDESVLLERIGANRWRVTPMPRDAVFTVAVDPAALGLRSGAIQVRAFDIAGHALGTAAPLSSSHLGAKWRQFAVNRIPGAVYYELESGLAESENAY